MHPSVFVDKRKKWHEDYWYLCFTQQLDCWDRDASEYEDEPLEMGGFELYSVYSYSLDEQVLDRIPLQNRQIFKMGSTQDGYIFCHKSLAHLFRGTDCGVELVAVPAY